MRANRKLIWGGVIAAAVALLLLPWKSTVAPAIRVQISDADGKPAKNAIVRQQWGHYNLGSDGEEFASTDENGYVSLPERSVRANLLTRLSMPIVGILTRAGFGPHGVIWAHGAGSHEWISHVHSARHPAPERLILKSWDSDIYLRGEREATKPTPDKRLQPSPQ